MKDKILYFAPVQGYTDNIYRRLHAEIIGGIDKYFLPYISLEPDGYVRKSKLKDCLPENNQNITVIPQILAGNKQEALILANHLIDYGYSSINLNLGCPFLMVVNKGRGCGLHGKPEIILEILDALISKTNLKISVKTRTGMFNHNEFEKLIPIFNSFPLQELILHPRTGKQQYKGEADLSAFTKYVDLLTMPVVYNGDVNTQNIQIRCQNELSNHSTLMIGRGLLENPLLANHSISSNIDKHKKLWQFIFTLFDVYAEKLDTPRHVLVKMQLHWEYLQKYFESQKKYVKKIKKATNIVVYRATVRELYNESEREID